MRYKYGKGLPLSFLWVFCALSFKPFKFKCFGLFSFYTVWYFFVIPFIKLSPQCRNIVMAWKISPKSHSLFDFYIGDFLINNLLEQIKLNFLLITRIDNVVYQHLLYN